MFRTDKTFHKTRQNHAITRREAACTQNPLFHCHQIIKGTFTVRFLPGLCSPHRAWHARSLDFQLAQRASGAYSTGSTDPAYLPTRNAGEREFEGFWILRTPLVTAFSSCNDPSDSAEAPFLLQKSVVIC